MFIFLSLSRHIHPKQHSDGRVFMGVRRFRPTLDKDRVLTWIGTPSFLYQSKPLNYPAAHSCMMLQRDLANTFV